MLRTALPLLVALALALPAAAQPQPTLAPPTSSLPTSSPATSGSAPPASAARPGAAAPAAEQPVGSQPAGAARIWSVTCADPQPDQPRACRISAVATLQPQGQRLLGILLLRQPETRSLVLVFHAAHGTLIPPGLTWQIDEGETQRLAYQTSDPEGLLVAVPVSDDLLAALRRGTSLRVGLVLAPRREALSIAVPLAQFTEATVEFFAAERQQTR